MQNIDLVVKSTISDSFRVNSVMNTFDLTLSNMTIQERIYLDVDLPSPWSIGVICGASGRGKSVLAKKLFPSEYSACNDLTSAYTSESVIDDMPESANISEITKMFTSVGFGSVPSWLKPYAVLSQGERMRVDLARCFLGEIDPIIFDEFTSVVDRIVAKTTCINISKSVRKLTKRFIAVSCHRDVIDWLSPDWVIDMDNMRQLVGVKKKSRSPSTFANAQNKSGLFSKSITI